MQNASSRIGNTMMNEDSRASKDIAEWKFCSKSQKKFEVRKHYKNQEKGKNVLEKGDMCNTLEPYKQYLMKINNYFKKVQDATLSFSHKHA